MAKLFLFFSHLKKIKFYTLGWGEKVGVSKKERRRRIKPWCHGACLFCCRQNINFMCPLTVTVWNKSKECERQVKVGSHSEMIVNYLVLSFPFWIYSQIKNTRIPIVLYRKLCKWLLNYLMEAQPLDSYAHEQLRQQKYYIHSSWSQWLDFLNSFSPLTECRDFVSTILHWVTSFFKRRRSVTRVLDLTCEV